MATRWRWPLESCARLVVEQFIEAEDFCGHGDLLATSASGRLAQGQVERHVVGALVMRGIERGGLEHDGDVGAGAGRGRRRSCRPTEILPDEMSRGRRRDGGGSTSR